MASLKPADHARNAVWKKYRLLRNRIGAGTKVALAVADLPSDIKSGPIVDRGVNRRLGRHARGQIGRGRQRTSRKYGRCSAPNYANPLHHAPHCADRFCVDCYSMIGPTLQLAAEPVDSRLRRPTTGSRTASLFE